MIMPCCQLRWGVADDTSRRIDDALMVMSLIYLPSANEIKIASIFYKDKYTKQCSIKLMRDPSIGKKV